MESCTQIDLFWRSGAGTWGREARRAMLLAAELGVPLDEETLLLYDVRDLQALQWHLRQGLAQAARRPRRAPWASAAARPTRAYPLVPHSGGATMSDRGPASSPLTRLLATLTRAVRRR